MHDTALVRAWIIEGMIFVMTTLLTYMVAYIFSVLLLRLLWPGNVRRWARTQLPLAWLLFCLYLVGGLAYYGALPTSPPALFNTLVLFTALSLVLLGWNRWRARESRRWASWTALLGAGMGPWLVVAVVQALAAWLT